MKQENNKNIQQILDKSIVELGKIKLNENDFRYRTIDYNLNLNFGVFGNNKSPCIGLNVKETFKKYVVIRKYKIITLLNAPSSIGQRVIIVLNDVDKIDIFKKLYKWIHQDLLEDCNLIRSFEDLYKYIDSYSDLFEKKSHNKISQESLLGLYGELDLLNELLEAKNYDQKDIVDSWTGYRRSTHDFNLKKLKLEVKSSLKNNNIIHCSSYNQLLSQNDFQTYLINFSYIENSVEGNGKSIFDIIDLIKTNLKDCKISLKTFERKLEIFGFESVKNNTKYSRINYEIYEIRDNFPSLNGLKIHSSISDIKYKVDLSLCENWLLPLNINEL